MQRKELFVSLLSGPRYLGKIQRVHELYNLSIEFEHMAIRSRVVQEKRKYSKEEEEKEEKSRKYRQL